MKDAEMRSHKCSETQITAAMAEMGGPRAAALLVLAVRFERDEYRERWQREMRRNHFASLIEQSVAERIGFDKGVLAGRMYNDGHDHGQVHFYQTPLQRARDSLTGIIARVKARIGGI